MTLPLSYSRLRGSPLTASARKPARHAFTTDCPHPPGLPTEARVASEGWWGGEGSNLRSPKAAGLQPAAIDRSATSPFVLFGIRAFGAFLKTSTNKFGRSSRGAGPVELAEGFEPPTC